MYLGQVNPITAQTWVYNTARSHMEKQLLTYSPALVKIFDEILVNAADNRLRGSDMSKIDVSVKYSKSVPLTISIKNDGTTVGTTHINHANINALAHTHTRCVSSTYLLLTFTKVVLFYSINLILISYMRVDSYHFQRPGKFTYTGANIWSLTNEFKFQ